MHRLARGALLALPLLAACGDDDSPGPGDVGPVATVEVVAERTRLLPGEMMSLRAVALDADGDTVTGRPVTWESNAATALAVGMDGKLEALAEGAATITATVDGVAGSAEFTAQALALVEIAAGDYRTCGLEADGQAWCWGEVGGAGFGSFVQYDAEYSNLPRPVGGDLRFRQLALAEEFGCGVTTTGVVHCWGSNWSGELGDGSKVARDEPQPVVGLGPAIAVAAEVWRACALLESGEVWCWGRNSVGQLGDGTYLERLTPVRTSGLAGATEIALGSGHSCALTAGGQAWCWGDDRNRQIGIDTSYGGDVPGEVVGGHTFSALRGYDFETCGVLATGGVRCWGREHWQPSEPSGLPVLATVAIGGETNCGLTAAGEAWCWGLNKYGGMGRGSADWDDGDPAPVLTDLAFTAITTGWQHACALTAEGEAWCWGRAPTGDGTMEHRLVPVAVATAERFVAIEAGLYHTCALTAVGAAWCWGRNLYGGTGTGLPDLEVLVPTKVAGGHVFASLAEGYDRVSCGITAAGEAWCWGQGALGEDGVEERATPGLVAGGHAFADLSAGWDRACGVTTTGDALCWERGTEPSLVAPGEAFGDIATGKYHTCALTVDGTAKCWGSNDLGQLGNGIRPFQPLAKPVVNGAGLSGLSAGDRITYGLDATGRAIGWPRGAGVVGADDVFPGTTFTHVVRRYDHGCAVRSDGVTICWGNNSSGQAGDGTISSSTPNWQPVVVSGEHSFSRIALGRYHTCGLTTDGEAWCWGRNSNWELGSERPRSESSVPVPVKVLGQ